MKGSDNNPIPDTKEECLEIALRWGSTLSHNNIIMGLAASNAEAIPLIAMADAGEVARLSALYPMLPSHEQFYALSDGAPS